MFVDASVIVAILGREPGFEEIEKRMSTASSRFFISPLVKFEASVALARKKAGRKPTDSKSSIDLLRQARASVDAFIEAIEAEEVAVSGEVGQHALDAAALYGKVAGHPAGLNFGDCFAYACAKSLGISLLYKGYDFAQTDLA